jgi:putative ABC transport system permease protein
LSERKQNINSNWSLRLFRWFCNPDFVEDIEGDLLERYEKRHQQGKAANRLLYLDVIRLFRPGIIRNFSTTQKINNYGMLQNNVKMAWRNALRQKQFTALNILGLTMGITIALMIGLYIDDENSFDTFHNRADSIYRINQSNIWGNWEEMMATTGPNVADALREDVPQFEQVTRLLDLGYLTVNADIKNPLSKSFKESNIYAAEENFLDVFSFELLAGDRRTALASPNSILLTASSMKRYYGREVTADEAIGKTIDIKQYDGRWKNYQVVGILADLPARSHIQLDLLTSLKSESEMMGMHGWKWIWTAFSTYGVVKPGTIITGLEASLQMLPPKWAPPTTERIFNQSFEEFTAGNNWKLELQPLKEIYRKGTPEVHPFGPTGNPQFIKIFGAVGLMVLLLSAINFMNLSTARSASRSKEVGVRKVLGSGKGLITGQFMTESLLYAAISTLLALVSLTLLIEPFNQLADKQIELATYFNQFSSYLIIIGFILLLGILAGSYPAFYLSSFRPIESLKGSLSNKLDGKSLRNSLVVFQFAISIALIICTFFVQKQLDYASKLDLGFAKDNILQLHNVEELGFDTEQLKAQIATNPAFTAIGKSFGIPPNVGSGDRYRASGPENPVLQLSNLRLEPDYLDVLDLTFLEGRNFDEGRPADKYKVIINEKAAEMLGWKVGETVGQKLTVASGNEDDFEVIGVVGNFNFQSIKQQIEPLVMIHHHNDKVWDHGAGLSYYSMRLNPGTITTKSDLQQVLLSLEKDLKSVDATVPFEYSFLDQEFENTFRSEERLGTILDLFAAMAMVIACLGLFGLAAFSAERRTKELGIRKVLGASIKNLALTFSSEFTRLLLISVLIACPIAWFLVDQWLADFAQRTPIHLWVFAVAIADALVIAVLTIGYQSLRIAAKNPVDTLKDE